MLSISNRKERYSLAKDLKFAYSFATFVFFAVQFLLLREENDDEW